MSFQAEDFLTCNIPNAPGRFKKLCAVRNQIEPTIKNQIVFSYNDPEDYPSKSLIDISICVSKGDEKTAAKLFMTLVNGCEEFFRNKQDKKEDSEAMNWSNLFKKPYPDYSKINTINELINFPTPNHTIKFDWVAYDDR